MRCQLCGLEPKGVEFLLRCCCSNISYIDKINQLESIPKEIVKRVKEWFANAWVLGEREPYLQKLDESLEELI